MTDWHPITPSRELIQEWINQEDGVFAEHIAIQAARWGGDQELDACCEWLEQNVGNWALPGALRSFRRFRPSSLKEQALADLSGIPIDPENGVLVSALDNIRSALEQLPD